jgi:hypothetical protein
MADSQDAINAAIQEVERADKALRSKKSIQVSSGEEKDLFSSIVYSWTRTHRPIVAAGTRNGDFGPVDRLYDQILKATSKNAARTTYRSTLKNLKAALVALRSELLVPGTDDTNGTPLVENAPAFGLLAADQRMQEILSGRWDECQRCLIAEAHLAATVMMGGLLEALFVAKANKMPDKGPLFKAKAAPLDQKTKKPLALKDWTLRHYIDVGHELSWITRSAKDVAEVLRDYRNYVHPEKERSHGVTIGASDSLMFWQITKQLATQLLGK